MRIGLKPESRKSSTNTDVLIGAIEEKTPLQWYMYKLVLLYSIVGARRCSKK